MLTDTFHERYEQRLLWTNWAAKEKRLNVQLVRVIEEQLFPPYDSKGAIWESHMATWKKLDSKLSMELGVEHLSPAWYGVGATFGGHTSAQICKNFMTAEFDPAQGDVDYFMKQRISFVELALREKAEANASLASDDRKDFEALLAFGSPSSIRVPGDPEAGRLARIKARDASFGSTVTEVNARFAAAGTVLNYHNGFVQITQDELVQGTVEKAFWRLVEDQKWRNVDTDIKEAMDRRDTGGRDGALYAAKALDRHRQRSRVGLCRKLDRGSGGRIR